MEKFIQQNPESVFLILGLLCLFLIVVILITIFFLLSMQKALSNVSPRNRLMEPAMVWLNLVPCLNLVWQFLIAIRVPDSLKNEFRDRGRDDGSDYGKSLGVTYCIIGLGGSFIGNIVSRLPEMEMIGFGVSLGITVLNAIIGIMFWLKIVGYSNQLASDDSGRLDRLGDFDDDDDDRGYDRRKRGSDKSDGIKEGDGY